MPSGDCCSGLPAGGDCSGLPAGDCRGLPAGDCMSMSGSGISSLLKKNNTLIPTKLLLQWLSFRVQYSEKSKDCIIYSHGDGSSLTLLTCFLWLLSTLRAPCSSVIRKGHPAWAGEARTNKETGFFQCNHSVCMESLDLHELF